MPTAEEQLHGTQMSCVAFELPQAIVYRASGKDHIRYLHARLTQDVKSLASGDTVRSLVLTPQGKIQGLLQILRRTDDMLLVAEGGGPDVLAAILQFKVADQIEVTPEELAVMTLQGPASKQVLEKITGLKPEVCPRRRGAPLGFDLLVVKSAAGELLEELMRCGAARGGEEGYELLRIEGRVPEMGKDLSEKIFAPEIDIAELVSTTKGCYTGQEVVEMTAARGKPNKRLCSLRAAGEGSLAPGDEIASSGKNAGFVTSSAYRPSTGKAVALGFVKSEHTEGLSVRGAPVEVL